MWAGSAAADLPANCTGGHTASNDDDYCCPVSSWSNVTYLSYKGGTAWQYWNEKRVQTSFVLMLDPTADSGFPSGLEQLAYDGNATLPSELHSALRRAAKNYYALFPPNRWYYVANVVADDCSSDGLRGVWRAKYPPFDQARVTALQDVTRQTLPSAYIDAMRSKGEFNMNLGPQYVKEWVAKATGVVNSAPGAAASFNHEVRPTLENVVTVQNGIVTPSAWVQTLIGTFAPMHGLVAKLTTASLLKLFQKPQEASLLTAYRPPPSLFAPPPPPVELAPAPEPEAGLSTGAKVAIGAGSLAVVGGGIYLFARRKR